MAPAKRKATGILPPDGSCAHLSSQETKLTTKVPDIEGGEMKQEAPTRAPRVQVSHACKERIDNITRALDFKSMGSAIDFLLPTPEVVIGLTELTTELGYDNGGQTIEWLLQMVRTKESLDFQNARRQLDWLLPIQTECLQELTTELGFHRGGQTVDWLLPMASNDFLNLTHFLGFQESAHTIQWLLHQAKPAIAARIAEQSTATRTAGYSSTYSSPAGPHYSTAQFPQNPEGVRPSTFTPTPGLGRGTTLAPAPRGGVGGSTTWYSPSSNPHTPIPSGGVGGSTTWYSSNPHIPTSSTATPTPTPVQRGYVFDPVRMMQPMSSPQSQISTPDCQVKSKQASLHNIQVANKVRRKRQVRRKAENNGAACSGNIVVPEVKDEAGVSTPMQYSINNLPNGDAASVDYGDRGIRMGQLQAHPQVNHFISEGSNSLHELGGTWNAQTHTRAMKLPVQNDDTASNDGNHMSSRVRHPSPGQDIIKQMQAHHSPTEIIMNVHHPSQLFPTSCNEGQSPLIQFLDDIWCAQINGETQMEGQSLTNNQIMQESFPGLQDSSHRLLNGGDPLAELNETNPRGEEENPVQENGKAMNEFVNTDIENQREEEDVNEHVKMENEKFREAAGACGL